MTDIKSLCSTAVRVPRRLVAPSAHTTRQIVIIMHSDDAIIPRKKYKNTHVLDHLKKLIFKAKVQVILSEIEIDKW